MNIHESIEEFKIEQLSRGNSRYTVIYYGYILKAFESFTDFTQTEEITLKTCREFYMKMTQTKLSTVSVQSYIRGLRAYLEWLYQNEYITTDIPSKFKLPKAQRKVIDILTDRELRRLVGCFDGVSYHDIRDICICALMFDCGLRLNEVVTLENSQLHTDEGYAIVTGKGNRQRTVPIGKHTGKLLAAYKSVRPSGKMLFLKQSGEPITDFTVKNLFRRLKDRSGIERLHPHLLRHTFATKYLENGGNIYSLQMILGHTSLEMVKKYLHLASNRIRADFGRYSPFDNLK